MFNGGLVNEAIKHPRGKGVIAVRAVWTNLAIDVNNKSHLLIHHIKNDMFVGTWCLLGLESHSMIPRETIVLLKPNEVTEEISQGDILILGRGAVSKYATNLIEPKPELTQAVEIGRDKLRGVLSPSALLGTELLAFHDPSDEITARDLEFVWSCDQHYKSEFAYIGTTIARYTLEFKLSGKAVTARSIIDVLSPIRSFVLDASEEMCLGLPRKKGRRGEDESELFEPVVTAKAASVRFRVHPSSSSRTKSLETSRPLKLLSELLRKANSGDSAGLRMELESNLKSVDESLKQIEAIVKSARRQRLEFSATDARIPISLGNKALSTIKSAETIYQRIEKARGAIYAVDLHRRWCRVSTDDKKDWRLGFFDDLEEDVRGNYPRRVEIEFETQTRPDLLLGRGRLLSIRDLENPNPLI